MRALRSSRLSLISPLDSTPTKLFPNCKSHWPEGLGQMTALGLRQMYDLGTRLRERYVDRFGLISSSFHTDEVFVRSTSKDRTLMSAHVRHVMSYC